MAKKERPKATGPVFKALASGNIGKHQRWIVFQVANGYKTTLHNIDAYGNRNTDILGVVTLDPSDNIEWLIRRSNPDLTVRVIRFGGGALLGIIVPKKKSRK